MLLVAAAAERDALAPGVMEAMLGVIGRMRRLRYFEADMVGGAMEPGVGGGNGTLR